MHPEQASQWSLFQMLCRVLGGRDTQTLHDSVVAGHLPALVAMAQAHDVLPALAVRWNEQLADRGMLDCREAEHLAQALRENTLRNMQISAQALKLTRRLNEAGVVPLFLKGTVQLLVTNEAQLGFRKQLDIDLLVEHAQLEVTAEALLEDGYRFYQFSGHAQAPTAIADIKSALAISAAHHHLPELMKVGQGVIVELHRHFLPSQFHRKRLLSPLFDSATVCENRGAKFRIPSAEFQLIQLILGKFVHEGHLARRDFPLREACDYLHIHDAASGQIDSDLVARHCGGQYRIVSNLIQALMGPDIEPCEASTVSDSVGRRIQLMERRYSSIRTARMLNMYARCMSLTHAFISSPSKLPAYLARRKDS